MIIEQLKWLKKKKKTTLERSCRKDPHEILIFELHLNYINLSYQTQIWHIKLSLCLYSELARISPCLSANCINQSIPWGLIVSFW